MGIKILLISANIGDYDKTLDDVPSELSGFQLLRIEDRGEEHSFSNINENTFLLFLAIEPLCQAD